jgi:hypothetical protein
MNAPSSITFNVGAPTFATVARPFRGEGFLGISESTRTMLFPFWNDAPRDLSMTLKTTHLAKPSSNTLNVGAPTFNFASACGDGFTPPSSRRAESAVSK